MHEIIINELLPRTIKKLDFDHTAGLKTAVNEHSAYYANSKSANGPIADAIVSVLEEMIGEQKLVIDTLSAKKKVVADIIRGMEGTHAQFSNNDLFLKLQEQQTMINDDLTASITRYWEIQSAESLIEGCLIERIYRIRP